MIIEKIKGINLKLLLNTIKQTTELRDENQFMMPGYKLSQICNMMSINASLKNVNTLELYYIKKMASKIIIKNKSKTNFVNKEKYPNMHQKVNELLIVNNEIFNDKDIDTTSTIVDNFLPIGCDNYELDVYFTGSSLLNIIGIIPASTFPIIDNYDNDEWIDDCLARAFAKSLYEGMTSKLTMTDTVCDYMFSRGFYEYIDSNVISLGSIMYPYGNISFYGADNSSLGLDINTFKDKKDIVSKDDIELVFGLNTVFSTYFNIFLNTDYIIDAEDFNPLFSKNKVTTIDVVLNKYKARISSGMDYLKTAKQTMIQNPTMNSTRNGQIDLNMYNFIFNGTSIKYLIKLPLCKLDELINSLDNSSMEYNDIVKSIKGIEKMISSIL